MLKNVIIGTIYAVIFTLIIGLAPCDMVHGAEVSKHKQKVVTLQEYRSVTEAAKKGVKKALEKQMQKAKKSKKMTLKKAKRIIRKQTNLEIINKIKLIDKYVRGKWYLYEVYSDGDIWILSIKKGKVRDCYQFN